MSRLSSPEDPSRKSTPPGRGLLLAGVAAAALMGVGLGLWARPAMSERRLALPTVEAPAPAPARKLQIVVEDTPAPLGAPIELLPASGARVQAAAPPRAAPEPLAPVRTTAGLVRVQSVEREPVEREPPARVARRPEPKSAPRRPVAAKPAAIKAAVAPKARPPKLEKARVVEKPKARPPASKVARADPKPSKAGVRLVKADRSEKPARIQKIAAKPGARPAGPIRAVERTAPRKAAAAPKPQKAKLELPRAKTPKPHVEKVVQKARPAKAAPPTPLKPARAAGPVRIAKAQPRPDTALRDADRQMNRAYSSARAAGVPDWQLRRQQARWEAARASAAREAPWAVHDVYLARIAELHDLTKDAQASGY